LRGQNQRRSYQYLYCYCQLCCASSLLCIHAKKRGRVIQYSIVVPRLNELVKVFARKFFCSIFKKKSN
jgi:hypothetical protein